MNSKHHKNTKPLHCLIGLPPCRKNAKYKHFAIAPVIVCKKLLTQNRAIFQFFIYYLGVNMNNQDRYNSYSWLSYVWYTFTRHLNTQSKVYFYPFPFLCRLWKQVDEMIHLFQDTYSYRSLRSGKKVEISFRISVGNLELLEQINLIGNLKKKMQWIVV